MPSQTNTDLSRYNGSQSSYVAQSRNNNSQIPCSPNILQNSPNHNYYSQPQALSQSTSPSPPTQQIDLITIMTPIIPTLIKFLFADTYTSKIECIRELGSKLNLETLIEASLVDQNISSITD